MWQVNLVGITYPETFFILHKMSEIFLGHHLRLSAHLCLSLWVLLFVFSKMYYHPHEFRSHGYTLSHMQEPQ